MLISKWQSFAKAKKLYCAEESSGVHYSSAYGNKKPTIVNIFFFLHLALGRYVCFFCCSFVVTSLLYSHLMFSFDMGPWGKMNPNPFFNLSCHCWFYPCWSLSLSAGTVMYQNIDFNFFFFFFVAASSIANC